MGLGCQLLVNLGEQFNRAFWWQNQSSFGDGDGVILNWFATSLDVDAHELTHGVTQFTAGFIYENQPVR